MWFATDPGSQANLVALPVERVREVIRMNQKGNKPERLSDASPVSVDIEPTFANVVGEESLTRFDKQQGRRKNRKKRKAPTGASQSGDTRSGSPKGAREQKPASGKPENRRSDKSAPGQQPARKQRVPADAAGGAPGGPRGCARVATTAVIAVAIRTEDRTATDSSPAAENRKKVAPASKIVRRLPGTGLPGDYGVMPRAAAGFGGGNRSVRMEPVGAGRRQFREYRYRVAADDGCRRAVRQ